MAQISYREALNQALREELDRDERVFIMGEEVGYFGGAFKVTDGLLAIYGERRVRDTPISELSFTGAGIGAATTGFSPPIAAPIPAPVKLSSDIGVSRTRRDGRAEAGRRVDDDQLRPACDRSDRQQRRQNPLYVRRPRQGADSDSRAAGR